MLFIIYIVGAVLTSLAAAFLWAYDELDGFEGSMLLLLALCVAFVWPVALLVGAVYALGRWVRLNT